MTSSTLISPATTPEIFQVWEPTNLFRVNWASGVRLQTSWMTDITTAKNTAEKRVGRLSKPKRRLSFTLSTSNEEPTNRVFSYLARLTVSRNVCPLYTDASRLTVAATAGDTVLNLDTRYRGFFVGQRILIGKLTDGPAYTVFEYRTIQSLTASTITVTVGLTNSYGVKSPVFPGMEMEPSNENEYASVNGRSVDASVSLTEVYGSTALDLRPAPSISMYEGFPIFAPTIGRIRNEGGAFMGTVRPTNSGVTEIYDRAGTRPRRLTKISCICTKREQAWEILGFFDYCKGALKAFMFFSGINIYSDVDILGDKILVRAVGPVSDWANQSHIGLKLRTGSPVIYRIVSVQRIDGFDVITIPMVSTVTADDVSYAGPAYLARFNTDSITETWRTTQVSTFELSVIELLNELDITIGGL